MNIRQTLIEVDTEMVEKLKAALGKAAVTEEEEDSGAESDVRY